MRTSYTSRLSGAISLVRFAVHIATIIVPYRSRGSLFATWPDGTRRSIRMKILQKHLRSGSHLDRNGESATKVGARWPSSNTSIASREGLEISNPSGVAVAPTSLSMRWNRRSASSIVSACRRRFRCRTSRWMPTWRTSSMSPASDGGTCDPPRRCCVSIASPLSTRSRIGAACNVQSSSGSWKPSANVLRTWAARGRSARVRYLWESTVYTTALSMNYLNRGEFIHS